jgi:protein TonB
VISERLTPLDSMFGVIPVEEDLAPSDGGEVAAAVMEVEAEPPRAAAPVTSSEVAPKREAAPERPLLASLSPAPVTRTAPPAPPPHRTAARPLVREPKRVELPDPPIEAVPEPTVPVHAEPPIESDPPVEILPGQLFDLAEIDVMPRPTKRDLPGYTRRAKRKKQQGRVGLELLIDEHGQVVQLRLHEKVPNSDLNDVVVEAAWGWRFNPALKGDVPVSVWTPVTIDFSIVSGQTRVQLHE